MAKIKCSGCGTIIEVDVTKEIIVCPDCGKKFRNKHYDPTAGQAPQEAPVAPQTTATEEKPVEAPAVKKLALVCPACKTKITFTSENPTIECPNCGKKYKNKSYIAPAAEEKPAEAPVPVKEEVKPVEPPKEEVKPVETPAPVEPVKAEEQVAPVVPAAPVVEEKPVEQPKEEEKPIDDDFSLDGAFDSSPNFSSNAAAVEAKPVEAPAPAEEEKPVEPPKEEVKPVEAPAPVKEEVVPEIPAAPAAPVAPVEPIAQTAPFEEPKAPETDAINEDVPADDLGDLKEAVEAEAQAETTEEKPAKSKKEKAKKENKTDGAPKGKSEKKKGIVKLVSGIILMIISLAALGLTIYSAVEDKDIYVALLKDTFDTMMAGFSIENLFEFFTGIYYTVEFLLVAKIALFFFILFTMYISVGTKQIKGAKKSKIKSARLCGYAFALEFALLFLIVSGLQLYYPINAIIGGAELLATLKSMAFNQLPQILIDVILVGYFSYKIDYTTKK